MSYWIVWMVMGAALAAIITVDIVRARRMRAIRLESGEKVLPDRFLAHELDHLAPGVMNWTFRDENPSAGRRARRRSL